MKSLVQIAKDMRAMGEMLIADANELEKSVSVDFSQFSRLAQLFGGGPAAETPFVPVAAPKPERSSRQSPRDKPPQEPISPQTKGEIVKWFRQWEQKYSTPTPHQKRELAQTMAKHFDISHRRMAVLLFNRSPQGKIIDAIERSLTQTQG